MTLRSQLYLLALGVLAPLVALAGLAAYLLDQQSRQALEAEAIGRVRATVIATDVELKGHIETLRALAASRSLTAGEMRDFHEEMVRVLKTQREWLNIGLTSAAGEQLADALLPYGAAAPQPADWPSFDRAVRTGEPQVGDIAISPVVNTEAVRVRLPVTVEGKVRYVLTAQLRLQLFQQLLRDQKLPPDWVIVLVDANRRFIARIPAQPPGAPISPSFGEALNRSPEGFFRGQTVEGFQTYTPYATSAFSGWVVGIAIPQTVVEAGARRAAQVLSGGFVLALVAALWLTALIARRIERPISELARAAAAMQSGQPAEIPSASRISQISALSSALHAASTAIREREDMLRREKTMLQETDRAKDEFIAMLSHELRNPLAALMAAAEVLRIASPTSDTAASSRKVVARQTKHMARLVEDLLDVSRIATGKVWLAREPLNLADAVASAISALRSARRLDAHDLSVDLQPVWVSADRARIEQVASNLLDNALKYTPEGRRIQVLVRKHDVEAIFRVSDEGEGILPDALERVFKLFVQGERGIDRQKGGMGVGLALVRRLVEMHGGTVVAESDGVGRGATFTVRLPAVPAQAVPAQSAAIRASSADPRRILLVEDNADVRESLRTALALKGHEVHDASNGEAALMLARAARPDVALIDLGLPNMTGFELARRLRNSFVDQRLALVALTGYGQPQDAQLVRESGFDLHLIKPVSPERVLEAISKLS